MMEVPQTDVNQRPEGRRSFSHAAATALFAAAVCLPVGCGIETGNPPRAEPSTPLEKDLGCALSADSGSTFDGDTPDSALSEYSRVRRANLTPTGSFDPSLYPSRSTSPLVPSTPALSYWLDNRPPQVVVVAVFRLNDSLYQAREVAFC
jgi:hypothetical protein